MASEELDQLNAQFLFIFTYKSNLSIGMSGMQIEINSSHNFIYRILSCFQRITLRLSHYSSLEI